MKDQLELSNEELSRMSPEETKARSKRRVLWLILAVAAGIAAEVILILSGLDPAVKAAVMAAAGIGFAVLIRFAYKRVIEAFADHIFNDTVK